MCFEINLYFRIRFNINIDYYENVVNNIYDKFISKNSKK